MIFLVLKVLLKPLTTPCKSLTFSTDLMLLGPYLFCIAHSNNHDHFDSLVEPTEVFEVRLGTKSIYTCVVPETWVVLNTCANCLLLCLLSLQTGGSGTCL